MSNTISVVTSSEGIQRARSLAQGHLVLFGFPWARHEMNGYLGGSGGVISTVEDMAHYLIMNNNGGHFDGVQLVSPPNIALMRMPPPDIGSPYGMGWFIRTEYGEPVLEHNGILSTFYADAVLLPEQQYGIVLLYNVQSLTMNALAFPRLKSALIAHVLGERPAPPAPVTVRHAGAVFAAMVIVTLVVGIRHVLRTWGARDSAQRPLWQTSVRGGCWLLPAVALAGLPWLTLEASGRGFGYAQLFRAMPDVAVWLWSCAALGVANAVLVVAGHVRSIRCSI
jgi:CubicO group peptidase (beta-lactamase class C family)